MSSLGSLRGWLFSTRPGRRVAAALFATVMIGAGAALGASHHIWPFSTAGGTAISCDLDATPSSFATQLTAAAVGATICLATGDYGTFDGTSKAVTIAAADGARPTMRLNFGSGDANFTIDGNRPRWDSTGGLMITGAVITNGAHDITIKNFESTSCPSGSGLGCRGWDIDPAPGPNANIVIDLGHFHDDLDGEATFFIDSEGVSGDTGIVIENSLFRHLSTDGVKLSGDTIVTVRNNKIMGSHSFGSPNHTDAIQFNSGTGSIITGNWVIDCDQGISGFDGMGSSTINHNVIVDCDAHAITLMGDDPATTVANNTIVENPIGEDNIICGASSGKSLPPSISSIYNNVAGGVVYDDGGVVCSPTRDDHNIDNTTVTYAGGSDPTTFTAFSDYCLAPSSAGYTSADDGGEVGVCGGDYNPAADGPPSGEGY